MDSSSTPISPLASGAASVEALRQALAAERRARQVAEVLHASHIALSRSLDPQVVTTTLLAHMAQLVSYDSACVMLLESDEMLRVRATRGYEAFTDPALVAGLSINPAEDPLFQQLIARRRSFVVLDTARTASWRARPGLEHVRNWFAVPLVAGEEVIGFFCADKTVPAFFTPEHVNTAELLAIPAAIALQNARLFAQVQAGQARLQALSERLVAVQEAERAHLARELHDEIGQMLTGLSLALTVGPRTSPETLRERMTQAQRQVNQLTAQVRALSLNLRPAMLDDLGLLPALFWFTRRYTDQTGIQVQLQHAGLDRPIPQAVASTAYRVVQEALTNVARHAGVDHARAQVWATDDMLAVQVVDEGRGFEADELPASDSLGLAGMAERVRLAGGTLTIETAPNAGTRILAELPLPTWKESDRCDH
ncbi:MAG: GAF domain-containing protein [Chloroflexaceae bacterium]